MFEICSDLTKTCLKIYYFCQYSKKAKKWPYGQTISILANIFKKGQMATLVPTQQSVDLPKRVPHNTNGRRLATTNSFLPLYLFPLLIHFVVISLSFYLYSSLSLNLIFISLPLTNSLSHSVFLSFTRFIVVSLSICTHIHLFLYYM